MRKVTVEVKVKLQMIVDEGIEISRIIDEMDYSFSDTTTHANITDTEILEHEVTDSR